jgi:hypothetical protein
MMLSVTDFRKLYYGLIMSRNESIREVRVEPGGLFGGGNWSDGNIIHSIDQYIRNCIITSGHGSAVNNHRR